MSRTNNFVDELSSLIRSIPDAQAVRLVKVTRAPRLQSRSESNGVAEDLMKRAKGWYDAEGLPFWDALFILGEREPDGVPDSIIKSALFHQDTDPSETVELIIDGSLEASIASVIATSQGRWIVAFTSEIRMKNGETRHIPMLDFTTKSHKPGALATVERAVEVLGVPGLLIASGRSYHFYGQAAMTAVELNRYLSSALLFAPITDSRWIAHQMLSGACALRISDGDKGFSPDVVGFRSGRQVADV